MGIRFGIDLGGTKIEIVALDDDGVAVHRNRVPTPSGDYGATIDAIVSLTHAAERALNVTPDEPLPSIGVGIPGTISPATGLVKNANSTCLIGRALDKDLSAALNRPVRLANDADCFALSEATDGAGKDASICFGVILGTGVGGGLVINRTIVRGPNAITGEWGHNPLPWPEDNERPGPDCYCGLAGCIETFLSGPGLLQDAIQYGGTWKSAVDVVTAAKEENKAARQAMDSYTARLAKSLAMVINMIDPDTIVLGGGLSNIDDLYDRVPQAWDAYVFSDVVATSLKPPVHGDSSGVRGAAWLWPQ